MYREIDMRFWLEQAEMGVIAKLLDSRIRMKAPALS
jgi:hypothetical protein